MYILNFRCHRELLKPMSSDYKTCVGPCIPTQDPVQLVLIYA